MPILRRLYEKKRPFRGNGTASNDCLPYEKELSRFRNQPFRLIF
jgi:hypothetical protein